MVEVLHWNAVRLIWALSTLAEIPFMFISGGLIRRFGAFRLMVFSAALIGIQAQNSDLELLLFFEAL
jgi:PPP family 3-phenylpropionic acid transporter